MKHGRNPLLPAPALALALPGCTHEGLALFERTVLGTMMAFIFLGVTSFLAVFTIVALILTFLLGPEIRSGARHSIAPSLVSLIASVLGLLWLLLALGLALETDETYFALVLIPLANLLLALFALVLSVRDRRRGLARQATSRDPGHGPSAFPGR